MTTRNDTSRTSTQNRLTRVPFSDISEPGVYVNQQTGALFRVPEDAIAPGHSPLIEIVCNSSNMVTKLNDDPWLPISKARQLAADADLAVDF